MSNAISSLNRGIRCTGSLTVLMCLLDQPLLDLQLILACLSLSLLPSKQ